jgi:hypothetical protein
MPDSSFHHNYTTCRPPHRPWRRSPQPSQLL